MIGFGEAISRFYTNYVNFGGRATRAEYWWSFLFQILVYSGLVIVLIAMAGGDVYANTEDLSATAWAVVFAGLLFALINFLPGLSVQVRRFHDLDQTGWLVLVFAIAGLIIPGSGLAQLIWFAFRGTDGPNRYGPDPFTHNADIFG